MTTNDLARKCIASAFRRTPQFVRTLITRLTASVTSVPAKKLAYLKLGCPSVVMAGPFEGMAYLDRATSSALMPKLVGTYELELRPTLQSLEALDIQTVVDIGAAEGYYAVGLLRFLKASRCVCFDIDAKARLMLAQIAAINAVEKHLDIRSECSPSVLNAVLESAPPRCLIVCDVDGAELEIINPILTPHLANCFLIIETHDPESPGPIVSTLLQRLSDTHWVESIATDFRRGADLDARVRHRLNNDMMTLAVMDEHRPRPQVWLIARPKLWEQ